MYKSNSLFYQFGHYIYRFRKTIITFWAIIFLSCLPFSPHLLNPFKDTGFVAEGSESDKAAQFLDKNLGFGKNKFLILYHHDHLIATDPLYRSEIKQSLKGLKNLDIDHDIIYPQEKQISADKHTAYVVIFLKTKKLLSASELSQFTALIKKPTLLTMQIGGEPIFIENINLQTQKDLFHGDLFAIPMSIITLLVIFGSVVATVVPIGIGACCALVMLTILFGIGHLTTLSIFTLNIASLLGLCLSLDYALFIINRFRDEFEDTQCIESSIQATLATAGKAVFYSGLAVFTSLSALLFFPVNVLYSIGIGGLVAVFVAVLTGLTLLPAFLSILGHRINAFPIRKITTQKYDNLDSNGLWYRIAFHVVRNAFKYFFFTLFFLLFLAYTVINIKVGVSNLHILPKQSENQMFFDTYERNFNPQEMDPIQLIVSSKNRSIRSSENISKLYDLVKKIKRIPGVAEVNSVVSIDQRFHKKQYTAMFESNQTPPNLDQLLKQTTGKYFTIVTVISKFSSDSVQTKTLIKTLRQLDPGQDLNIQLTGSPVINEEVLTAVSKIGPYAIAWVFVITYLILLLLLRSLFLPLKAIFMNVLSLCTSYGVLVYIFQEGHFHTWLHFNPQGILDINLIIILFCALFGFSMDYEVFLLSRIHESYLQYRDNNQSIIFGIVKSSRIITSAALIVIVLCGSYMVADVLMVKAFGLGVAVAIFVDAFLIRTILVPAAMSLLKGWNWYLPKWLERLLPKKPNGN